MRFSVKPILNTPGKRLPFRFTMDFSQVDFGGQYPVQKPIQVDGYVRNTAGMLELFLTAHADLDCLCDRCGRAFRREKEIPYQCVLAEERESDEDEDIVLLEDGEFVDVEELASTAWILGMDTKLLCSENCKGLCPRCGADLNLGPCSCKKELDPRMAVLGKLLRTSQTNE